MSIRYRFKRSSGPVLEPIPAHPDAIYRPQHRPVSVHSPLAASNPIAPNVFRHNPVVAAPLAAGGGGFSPWWIIGPLLALLAAMALGTLTYAVKKKQNVEKNDKETNENEKDPEDNDHPRISPVENMPLRSMKPDMITNEQKKTAPISSTVKDNSISLTDPTLSNNPNEETSDKSTLSTHGLPMKDDDNTPSLFHQSPHRAPPINTTRMAKPNSDVNTKADEKHSPKLVSNTSTDPLHISSLKNIRSVPINKTAPNYSQRSPPTSTTQKLNSSDDNKSDLNSNKPTSNNELNKKENQPTDFNNTNFDRKSSSNLDRIDHSKPLKARQDTTSSNSRINNIDTTKTSDSGQLKKVNSSEEHGVGKSPLVSDIPTGSKRKGKTKENESSRSLSSNPNLQQQNSSKENIYSNKSKSPKTSLLELNKDKHQSTLTIYSKSHSLSDSNETISSIEPTRSNKSKFSNPNENPNQKITQPSNLDKNPTDNKSDTSITNPNLSNYNKIATRMPNVPLCKTNTSSEDDDYDEFYALSSTKTPIEQTISISTNIKKEFSNKK